MPGIHRLFFFVAAFAIWTLSGCASTQQPTDVITVTGAVWSRGQAPFTELVLTTEQDNHYVLAGASQVGIQAPAQWRITGRVYAADWNGERFAHLEVLEADRIE
jgi:hypothetical protein